MCGCVCVGESGGVSAVGREEQCLAAECHAGVTRVGFSFGGREGMELTEVSGTSSLGFHYLCGFPVF